MNISGSYNNFQTVDIEANRKIGKYKYAYFDSETMKCKNSKSEMLKLPGNFTYKYVIYIYMFYSCINFSGVCSVIYSGGNTNVQNCYNSYISVAWNCLCGCPLLNNMV